MDTPHCLHLEEAIVVGQYVLDIVAFDALAQYDIGYGNAALYFARLLKVLVEVLQG